MRWSAVCYGWWIVVSYQVVESADGYGVTAEHVYYGGQELLNTVNTLINNVLLAKSIPPAMKLGILNPIFKNRGSHKESVNYRWITITPVLTRLLETVLKLRIQSTLLSNQITSKEDSPKIRQRWTLHCCLKNSSVTAKTSVNLHILLLWTQNQLSMWLFTPTWWGSSITAGYRTMNGWSLIVFIENLWRQWSGRENFLNLMLTSRVCARAVSWVLFCIKFTTTTS